MKWYWVFLLIMFILLIYAIFYMQTRINTIDAFIHDSCLTYTDLMEMNKKNGSR